MAITQYQIFCRYLNQTVNRALTNQTQVEWYCEDDLKELADNDEKEYARVMSILNSEENQKNPKIIKETCIFEPADSKTDINSKKAKMERDLKYAQIIIDETKALNPKYDMVFMYNGLSYKEAEKADYDDSANTKKQTPYLYHDRMKRIKLDPWFLFSTHASLNSAMTKAKELVNILGKDAVKIGKVVPLDQYIEIV